MSPTRAFGPYCVTKACLDEFGPLNLMPGPGRRWTERGGRHKDPDREPRPGTRATYNREIRRYIVWRNNRAADPRLRQVVARGERCLIRH